MGNNIGGGEEAGEFDTLVDVCLVPSPHFSARPKRCGPRGPCENVRTFPARSPRIRHRNKLTERDWENAVQGLGKVDVIRQKNGWRAFIMWWFSRLKFCILKSRHLDELTHEPAICSCDTGQWLSFLTAVN